MRANNPRTSVVVAILGVTGLMPACAIDEVDEASAGGSAVSGNAAPHEAASLSPSPAMETSHGVTLEILTLPNGTSAKLRDCQLYDSHSDCNEWQDLDLSNILGDGRARTFASLSAYVTNNNRIQLSIVETDGEHNWTKNCASANGSLDRACATSSGWTEVKTSSLRGSDNQQLLPNIGFNSSFFYSPGGQPTYTQSLTSKDGKLTKGRNCPQAPITPTGVNWHACGAWYDVSSSGLVPGRPNFALGSNSLIQYGAVIEQTLVDKNDGQTFTRRCNAQVGNWYDNCAFGATGLLPFQATSMSKVLFRGLRLAALI